MVPAGRPELVTNNNILGMVSRVDGGGMNAAAERAADASRVVALSRRRYRG